MRVIIPAAGRGTRLKMSDLDIPKVMVKACGKPLLETVLRELSFVSKEDIYIVVGYHKEKVMAYFGDDFHYVEQKEQLGTGHAVLVCEPWFRDYNGTVLVTFGDMPLFRGEVMRAMCEFHEAAGAACTLLTAENPELPFWARVVRDEAGAFRGIVEAKDCGEKELEIKELFSGVLAFDAKALFEVLPLVGRENVQHEYYLTEVPALMAARGMKVLTYFDEDGDDLRGVNTPEDLLICEAIMKKRGMG